MFLQWVAPRRATQLPPHVQLCTRGSGQPHDGAARAGSTQGAMWRQQEPILLLRQKGLLKGPFSCCSTVGWGGGLAGWRTRSRVGDAHIQRLSGCLRLRPCRIPRLVLFTRRVSNGEVDGGKAHRHVCMMVKCCGQSARRQRGHTAHMGSTPGNMQYAHDQSAPPPPRPTHTQRHA